MTQPEEERLAWLEKKELSRSEPGNLDESERTQLAELQAEKIPIQARVASVEQKALTEEHA